MSKSFIYKALLIFTVKLKFIENIYNAITFLIKKTQNYYFEFVNKFIVSKFVFLSITYIP